MEEHRQRAGSKDSIKPATPSESGLHISYLSPAQPAIITSRQSSSLDFQGGVNSHTASAKFISRRPSVLWPDAREHLLRRLSHSSGTSIRSFDNPADLSSQQFSTSQSARPSLETTRPSSTAQPFLIPHNQSAISLYPEPGISGFLPSSLQSLSAVVMNGPWNNSRSNASSIVGSEEDNGMSQSQASHVPLRLARTDFAQ